MLRLEALKVFSIYRDDWKGDGMLVRLRVGPSQRLPVWAISASGDFCGQRDVTLSLDRLNLLVDQIRGRGHRMRKGIRAVVKVHMVKFEKACIRLLGL